MPLLEEKVYTIDDIYVGIYTIRTTYRTHQKISMELSARILESSVPIREMRSLCCSICSISG